MKKYTGAKGSFRNKSTRQGSGIPDCVIGKHAVKAVLTYQKNRGKKLYIQQSLKEASEFQSLAQEAGVPTHFVPKEDLFRLNGDQDEHQGVLLEVTGFPYADFKSEIKKNPQLIVMLDGVLDPRNLGRAARTAFAFGADLLVFTQDRAASVSKASEKAATGALARLKVARVGNLNQAIDFAKDSGIFVMGAALEGKRALWEADLSGPLAMVIGSEEKGLRRLVREKCDELYQIPMAESTFSLNAADACALCLYEYNRQGALAK